MDWQAMFNLAMAGGGILLGALGTVMWQIIRQIQTEGAQMRASLAENYVRRDDYRDDMRDVKAMLEKISDKLDAKADK